MSRARGGLYRPFVRPSPIGQDRRASLGPGHWRTLPEVRAPAWWPKTASAAGRVYASKLWKQPAAPPWLTRIERKGQGGLVSDTPKGPVYPLRKALRTAQGKSTQPNCLKGPGYAEGHEVILHARKTRLDPRGPEENPLRWRCKAAPRAPLVCTRPRFLRHRRPAVNSPLNAHDPTPRLKSRGKNRTADRFADSTRHVQGGLSRGDSGAVR